MPQAESQKVIDFQSLKDNVGRFNLGRSNKTILIPEMNRIGGHLMAAVFRGFGIQGVVMDTYKGLELGKAYTSGKECYPCQITTGDILYYLKQEQKRLGDGFNANNYIYFMPEAGGPCRFGMYNKYQRIVLDSFPDLKAVKIGSLTTNDGYSLDGMIDDGQVSDLRKAGYLSVVVSDSLDRLLWRIRPYEKEPGAADDLIETSMKEMEDCFETYGVRKQFDKILDEMERIIQKSKAIMDPEIPEKPLIGVVGEIYLRSHVHANQDLIRVLETHGAEIVNASIAEWVNFTSYERLRDTKTGLRLSLKQFRINEIKDHLKNMVHFAGDLLYQQAKQGQVYKRARSILNLEKDHKIKELENVLKKNNLFSFDVGTEACLSIAGICQYAKAGFNGVVNVYPFACMPSTITSAVIKPLMSERGVPYLDTPYDSSFQPGREAAIRTFMYQAYQHFNRNGRHSNHK